MAPLSDSRILDRSGAVMRELLVHPAWRASLEQATARPRPLLVTSIAPTPRSGRRLPDYFIVSVQRGKGVSARFAHDAETGAFLEAEAVRTADGVLPEYVDPTQPLPIKGATTPAIATHETVWQPCAESASRFLPFFRFLVQGQPVYLRADGVLFETLTVNLRG